MAAQPKRPLTSAEVRRLLDACRTDHERHTLLLFANFGLPVSVVAKLGPRNLVRRANGFVLRWPLPHGGRVIESPVPEAMAGWVRAWLAIPIVSKYEGRRDGQPHRWASSDYYQKLVKAVAVRAGLPGVSPLSLRNSAAYALAQAAGPRVASELTGIPPSVIAAFDEAPGTDAAGRGKAVAALARALGQASETPPL